LEIPKVTATISVVSSEAIDLVVQPTAAPKVANIFDAPIDVRPPPAVIGSRVDHPVPRTNIVSLIFTVLLRHDLPRFLDRSEVTYWDEQVLRRVFSRDPEQCGLDASIFIDLEQRNRKWRILGT
jgi:hypothetical protein